MTLKFVLAGALAAAGLGAAVTAVPGLETLNWSEADLRTAVQETTRYDGSWGPLGKLMNSSTRRAVKALDMDARTALVKTSAPIAKSVVMSPAFLKAHDEWIAKQFDAVNHGMKGGGAPQPKSNDPDATLKDMERQLAGQMFEVYSKMPVDAIKQMLEMEVPQWKENLKGADATARARYQKLLARANQILPLAASDPAAFQKGYGILKSIEQGGPESEDELSSLGDEAKKAQQQRNYDQYNLRAILKKRLNEFVKVANSVDFKAPTASAGNQIRFTTPQHERASPDWKLLYRFGQAPTQAAAAFAQQWAKDL